jgi:hypothetical protein
MLKFRRLYDSKDVDEVRELQNDSNRMIDDDTSTVSPVATHEIKK